MPPAVVICGRTNVGKSTLFNILCSQGKALVHNRPGVTRDWISAKLPNANLELVDTAGMELSSRDGIGSAAWQQSIEKIKQSQLVLFMVDGQAGLLPYDQLLAKQLRKLINAKLIMLLVNKAENLTEEDAMGEFQKLGFARWQLISAVHGRGISALRNMLAELDSRAEPETQDSQVKVAIIGRPNVGKSTLANKILGTQRMLVADRPGTTVDSIDTTFEYEGSKLRLIDTAGMRRQAKATDILEKQGGQHARVNAQRADIILFMADASEGVVHQDQQLARLVCRYGKSTVILLNKSDLITRDKRRETVNKARKALPYMEFARLLLINANRPRFSPRRIMDTALKSFELANQRSTPQQITKVLRSAVSEIAPPSSHGKHPALRYAHQAGNNPILIIIHGRHVDLIKEPYQRYLANKLRNGLGYSDAPLHIRFKESMGKPARMS